MTALSDILTQHPWLVYALIISVSAIIGWGTNWLAVKMTFYPLDFVGIKSIRLGWQGLIPYHSQKIGQKTVDLITEKLLPPQELVQTIDPKLLSKALVPVFENLLEPAIEDIIESRNPRLWEFLPKAVRRQVKERALASLPHVVECILEDVEVALDDLVDIRSLVGDAITGDNREILNELFWRCGEPEFKFIIRCGLYFGAGLGALQAAIWYFVQAWWLLPVAGIFIGYLTNWVALKMIFEPIHPKKYFGFEYQGLFLKRQPEVAAAYGELIGKHVVVPDKIVSLLFDGKGAEQFGEIVHLAIRREIDEQLANAKGFVVVAMGAQSYVDLKKEISAKVVALMPKYSHVLDSFWDEHLRVGEMIEERLCQLPAEEFEDVLHSVFKEDEWLLILVGALLGMGAGWIQTLFLLN